MIDPHTVAILRAYFATRARWQLAAGTEWPHTEFLFVRPDGQPWHPDQLSDRFERIVRDAGLPPIRFHDLRHCAARYLQLAGADMKKIPEILGHSSIVITADTYTLLFDGLDRTAADQAANLIHNNRRGKSRITSQTTRQRIFDRGCASRQSIDEHHHMILHNRS